MSQPRIVARRLSDPRASFSAPLERLEPRRLLCGDHLGEPAGFVPPGPLPPQWCYPDPADPDGLNVICCDDVNQNQICDSDENPDPDPQPPEPPEPDPDDPNPDDPPLPDPDPCGDWALVVDLDYEGMRNEDVANPPHPQHETNPGGYLPLNTGFSEFGEARVPGGPR